MSKSEMSSLKLTLDAGEAITGELPVVMSSTMRKGILELALYVRIVKGDNSITCSVPKDVGVCTMFVMVGLSKTIFCSGNESVTFTFSGLMSRFDLLRVTLSFAEFTLT